jgi:hypothetical protein
MLEKKSKKLKDNEKWGSSTVHAAKVKLNRGKN